LWRRTDKLVEARARFLLIHQIGRTFRLARFVIVVDKIVLVE